MKEGQALQWPDALRPFFNLLCSPSVHAFISPELWTKCSILLMEMSSSVTCFHKMSTQMPESSHGQSLTVTNSMYCCFTCLSTSLMFRTVYQPVYMDVLLNECPVKSPVITCTWFLLKLSHSPAFSVEGILRKTLACFYLWMDCQHSSCFLFIQPLITSQATFASKDGNC